MIRFFQIVCVVPLLAFSMLAGELTFKNVHVRTRTLADAERSHGYAAHQFELENLSTTQGRTVTIELPRENFRSESNIEIIRRTVTLGPKSRKVISLYQPPLDINSFNSDANIIVDGTARRLDDAFGVHVDELVNLGNNKITVVLASRSWGGGTLAMPASAAGSSSSAPAEFSVNIAEGPTSQWPRHWLAFSGFDVVVVRAKEWDAAPSEVQQALLQYVRAGGRLFVLGKITLPADARLQSASQMTSRKKSENIFRKNVVSLNEDHFNNEAFPHEENATGSENQTQPGQGTGPVPGAAFALGWGYIHLMDSPVNDELANTKMLAGIKTLSNHTDPRQPVLLSIVAATTGLYGDYQFYYDHQNSGSYDSYFPIVEDSSVPVRLMIVILIGFVVLAGPVNLVLLHKFKKRTWFLWTLPAISILTSAIVFGTVLLNEGFTPTVRRDVITILNQETQQATTVGALGIYAPVAPGELNFSAHTEVTPLLNYRGNDPGGNRGVDWTKGQRFTGKWVTSRVPAHFALRKSEPRKERLSVTWKGGTPTVVNSLGADILHLWLADARGNIFEASILHAGQRVELQRSSENQTVINHLNTEFLLSTKIDTPENNYPKNLVPGTYLARMAGSPFMENPIGRGQLKTHAVVYGVLKQSEAGP